MTPMNRRQWQRTMAKWDTFENVLGTRDTLWEDIEEFGTLAQATDQRRTESRWDAGREGSGNSKADNGRREQCRLLLDWTRGFMRLRLLSEKIETSDCTRGQCPCFVYWCKHWRGDTIGYLVRPVGLETVLSRIMGTNWSPVFLVGAKKKGGGEPGVVQCFERWGGQFPGTRRELGRQMRRSWSAWRCTKTFFDRLQRELERDAWCSH